MHPGHRHAYRDRANWSQAADLLTPLRAPCPPWPHGSRSWHDGTAFALGVVRGKSDLRILRNKSQFRRFAANTIIINA
jgi:hypothetical protein